MRIGRVTVGKIGGKKLCAGAMVWCEPRPGESARKKVEKAA
jgi:hypothetical protein